MNIDIRGACILVDEPLSNSNLINSIRTIPNNNNNMNLETIVELEKDLKSNIKSSVPINIINNTNNENNESKSNSKLNINSIHNSLDLKINSNDANSNNNNNSSNSASTSPPKVLNSKDKPIVLPNQSSPVKHFALDIGGTLAKLVYFVQDNHSELGGKLHFIKFQTTNIDDCIDFIIENKLHIDPDSSKPKLVRVTGGGAYKYADLFERKLGCKLVKADEMQCLIWGTNFLLHNIQRESYCFDHRSTSTQPKIFTDRVENPYPYLLVQIGSGVSIIKVDSEDSFQRVDGTSLGGGTFWGLCSLLTGVTDFDEMLELTKQGQSNNVDLVVGDIYGTDYSKVGLSSDTIASSFGKIIYKINDNNNNSSSSNNNNNSKEIDQLFQKEDIAQSLLKMISNNIGQIAYLNSQRYGLNNIYFGGFFIRDHPNTMHRISFAIDFWSKGKTKASFLVHDGYLGALGAFLSVDANEKPHTDVESWWKRTTREIQKLLFKENKNNNQSNSSSHSNHNNHNGIITNTKLTDSGETYNCECEFCENSL